MYRNSTFQKLPTWMWELVIAVCWLWFVIVVATDWTSFSSIITQFFSFFGVLYTFMHMQVGSRLAEQQANAPIPTVECHAKLTRYLIAKELCWALAFVWLGAWTALAGQPLFLLYPVWRKNYKRL